METPIKRFLKDGYLFINKLDWRNLKLKHSKEELISFFIAEVKNKNLAFPFKRITEKDARKDFINLMNYKCNDYQDNAGYKVDYKYKSSGKCIYEKSFPYASDYFQQLNRMNCGYISFPSPIEVFQDEKKLHRLFDGLFVFEHDTVTSEDLLQLLQLRFYIASKFKCSVAKSIYEKFNAVNVLDFSSGWGDRLCGFFACENTRKYIGIDPNKDTYKKYYEQAEFYNDILRNDCNLFRDNTEKEIELYNLPAEDVKLDKGIVDVVFTSPPYFNIERYTKDENQSCNRYLNKDSWLKNFMFKCIDLGSDALIKDGYFLLNIADRADIRVCDEINDYFKKKGLKYIDCVGMCLQQRPNQRFELDSKKTLCEPIWVWQKK